MPAGKSQLPMHLALILEILACVSEFHAVVPQETLYLETRRDPEQAADFGLVEMVLPVRIQKQRLQRLAG